jgi:Ca2+/Na+ antiporter
VNFGTVWAMMLVTAVVPTGYNAYAWNMHWYVFSFLFVFVVFFCLRLLCSREESARTTLECRQPPPRYAKIASRAPCLAPETKHNKSDASASLRDLARSCKHLHNFLQLYKLLQSNWGLRI